jgi:ATP-dependent Clp endopeptidase proteolytic subunit ClpP
MRTWYEIKAQAPGAPGDISIHDEIGAFGTNAQRFINDLKRIEANEINLSINSPGGSVFDGIAIYNALRNSGKTINVKVLGVAASIASVVAMAGDKIVMPENAFMMVHNPWAVTKGNAEELREFADVLDKIGASLVATYVARTGKSEDEIKTLLADETYLTAAEAKELGFADEVEPALKAVASFDLDCLPANVQAAYQDAQQDDKGTTTVDPAFADQVALLAAQAGLADFALVFAMRGTDLPAVQADIAVAREIQALCALAKKPEAAAAHIKASKTLADVRAALLTALADQDAGTAIDTNQSNPGAARATSQPAAVTTASIWAARRNRNPIK